MRKKFFQLVIFLLVFGSCFNSGTEEISVQAKPLRILVPLYSYPTDKNGEYWQKTAQAGNEVPVCVIWGIIGNVDTGFYRQWLEELRTGQNVKLLAYVATTNAERNPDSIKAKVKFYAENFDIDGIFFDEVNSSKDKTGYYKDLTDYAKSFSNIETVILNSPYAPPEFATITGADAVLFYENTSKYWNDFDWEAYSSLPSEKKAAIISGVWLKSKMKKIIEEAAARGFGYVFVTNRGYDKLPTYWEEEVEVIKSLNR